MTELPTLRFIPFRRSDIVQMCLSRQRLGPDGEADFALARETVDSHFGEEFHQIRRQLKQAYAPLDPDADTRVVQQFRDDATSRDLAATLEKVLDRANYERLDREGVKKALENASLFKIRLFVDLDDFEEVLLYTRGASRQEAEVPRFMGFWPRPVSFTNYDRVVLYIRFREDVDVEGTLGGCQPGSTMLKLFQNVPAADMEMLFPNTRVGMRLLDKLLLGVPAVISGGVVMTTKMGATLVLLSSLLGFWLGLKSEPVALDRGAVLILLAGLGALGGYLWQQFAKFRNRKLSFTQALTESLYFKLLDNNAGVIFRILDEAEESECKESLIAYYFLLEADIALTPGELDEAIEQWFSKEWNCRLDFEITDALGKLLDLNLVQTDGTSWTALGVNSAARPPALDTTE